MDTSRSLQNALEFLEAHPNWFIFPVVSLEKTPAIKDNLKLASNDPAQIKKWHSIFRGCNWGLALTKSKVIVVDVDRKEGKVGEQTFDALTAEYDNFPNDAFPATLKVLSPSGGWHLYYNGTDKVSHAHALGEAGFGKDVDSPGYVLISGCVLCANPDQPYQTISNADIADAPDWFAEKLRKKERETGPETIPVVTLDQESNITWYIKYLQGEAPRCIQGDNGEKTLLDVAAVGKDHGISELKNVELLNLYYNDYPPFGKCDPPWTVGTEGPIEDRLDAKVANAYTYLTETAPGSATPEAEFDGDTLTEEDRRKLTEDAERDSERDQKARSARQARVESRKKEKQERTEKVNASLRDLRRAACKEYVYIANAKNFLKRSDLEFTNYTLDVQGFDNKFAHLRGEHTKFSKWVFENPDTMNRRDYMAYIPGQDEFVGDAYNLYRPSDIQPIPGDTSVWDAHIEYLFPDADQRDHLLNWFGWLVQNIDQKPMHALLLAGRQKGTGKSLVGMIMSRIVGKHNTAHIEEGALESSFNEWAKKTKLVMIEELQSLDRGKAKKTLHSMITQIPIMINDKNVKRYKMDNCFGIMAMTNTEAAIQLENDDRRYLVLRTEAEPREPEYYRVLLACIHDPAFLSAVYYQLLTRELKNYQGTDRAPMTKAKQEMIESGMSDLEHFMVERRHQWPLCNPVVCIDDIKDRMLPANLQRLPRLHNQIALILRMQFRGQNLGPTRIGEDKRKTLWAINGSGVSRIEGAAAPVYLRTLAEGAKQADKSAADDFADDADDI